MTKPTKWACAQRKLRSALASAQSDQSLRCINEESLDPSLPIERTAKSLIRLGGCPGWSESSLSAQPLCWFCHDAAHILMWCEISMHVIFFLLMQTNSGRVGVDVSWYYAPISWGWGGDGWDTLGIRQSKQSLPPGIWQTTLARKFRRNCV